MCRHPLPVVEGYIGHMPEAIIGRAFEREFRTQFVNERPGMYW